MRRTASESTCVISAWRGGAARRLFLSVQSLAVALTARASHLPRDSRGSGVLLLEMLARTLKNMMRAMLREARAESDYSLRIRIVAFLNAVAGWDRRWRPHCHVLLALNTLTRAAGGTSSPTCSGYACATSWCRGSRGRTSVSTPKRPRKCCWRWRARSSWSSCSTSCDGERTRACETRAVERLCDDTRRPARSVGFRLSESYLRDHTGVGRHELTAADVLEGE
jgi:hypothetical protein